MIEARPHLPPELESRIREIAIRLRRRTILQGWMRFGICTLSLSAVLTLALVAGEKLDWLSHAALPLFIIGELAALIAFVLIPLRQRIEVGSIARFIDERHPELEDRILSAVEFSGRAPEGELASAWMIERCLEEARVRVEEIRWSDLVDVRLITRLAALASFFLLLSLGVMLVRSDLWLARFPTLASLVPSGARQLDFTVEPGDARIRKGASQIIWVKSKIAGRKVNIQFRAPDATEWTTLAMAQGASEQVHHHEFAGLQSDLEYRVRFGGETSSDFKLSIWSPPQLEAIDLTYHYPEYLGRASRETPNSGNITAVEGTRVELAVKTNKAIKSAHLALESGERIPLRQSLDTVWVGDLELSKDDKYQVELVDLDDAPSEYNPRYNITVQPDKPPQVKLEFPRGDTEVTMLDEVPVNFQVEDDFGLDSYGLRYEIAGQEPKMITLQGEGGSVPMKMGDGLKAGGAHMLELEKLSLQSDDLVSWTVWAKDRKPGRDPDDLLSDIYFLEIRPFRSEFEQSESDMPGMEGMTGENQDAADQKEIIIATWNLKRRAKSLTEEEFAEQKDIITSSQRQIQQGVQKAFDQKQIAEEAGKALLEAIGSALGSLKRAALPSPGDDLGRALVEMQKAYSLILKQKPDRTQVQNMKGEGNMPQPEMSEDVAELEMDQNRNFYEEEKKTRQSAQEDTEKVRSKIKELAQRQKLIHAEIAKLISEMKKAQTEEEREKLRRQLESLREEERKAMERLDELQKDVSESKMDGQQSRQASAALEDVRQQMNRTLENMQNEDRLQQARLSSSRALDQLEEMDENLQNVSRSAAAEMMRDLQKEMNDLVEKQDSLSEKINEMRGTESNPSLRPQENTNEKINELLTQKQEMAEQFKNLMNEAGELAEKSRQSQELLSRKLGDWLRETAADGILEEMQASEPMIEHSVWPSVIESEQSVSDKLNTAQERLGEAAQALIEDDLQGMQKALDQLQSALDSRQSQNRSGSSSSSDENTSGSATAAAATNEDPKSKEILRRSEQAMQRAESFMRNGKPEEAARQLEQALDKDSHNADARNQLGLARAQMGQLEQAIEEFKQALADNPGHEAAENNLEKAAAMLKESQKGEQAGGGEKKESEHASAQGGQSPGEENQSGQGEREGAQEGQSKEGQGKEGEGQEGQQPGGQQPGEQPSGQQPGGQQSGSQQAGAQQGESQEGQPSSTASAQSRPGQPSRGGDPNGTSAASGWESWQQPPSPRFMEQFMQRDYQHMVEQLRDAEALLPRESESRTNIERVRNRVEELRQEYRRHSVAPQYELFLNDIIRPAAETADLLSREIREALKDQEYLITDEGEIPAQYRSSVADYFESLSRLADAER